MSSYDAFLAGKSQAAVPVGFTPPVHLNPHLRPFQAHVVAWAVRQGRAALFEDCGLGKTLQQLEWARQVVEHTGGRVLLLAPLAVTAQTVAEGKRFGIKAQYASSGIQVGGRGIYVTNYERLEGFHPGDFQGVVLDESSILKAFSGKTKVALVDSFKATPYRLACTATPAPNDVVELGNHAEFLGVMDSQEMLARWFINDTANTGTYVLKGHAAEDFWRWVATWAVCLSKPSDLVDPATGQPFSDEGYVLPELRIFEHVVKGPVEAPPPGQLFALEEAVNATSLARQLKKTIPQRAARAAELVKAEANEPWVLWCNTDAEADALCEALPRAVEVRGSQPPNVKAERLEDFSEGRTRTLVTKPRIAGFGLNWQHGARMVFVGLSYSYEQLYQVLRREWRFGQKREVHAHIVVSGSEAGVYEVVKAKQAAHREQQAAMVRAMREVQLADAKRLKVERAGAFKREKGEDWELYLGDCVEVARSLPDGLVDLSVFSPPFSNLYQYTDKLNDMGNCVDDAEFFEHFKFLIPELLRITRPGRLAVVHSKDLPRYQNSSGASGLRDFPGDITKAFESVQGADGSRWVYHSRVTIWKCPVTEMRRTNTRRLLFKTLKTDASHTGMGLPDYLTIYRKWSPGEQKELEVPITHRPEDFPLEQWQQWASPVWFDIDQTNVLNEDAARDDKDSKHICLARGSLVLTRDGYRPIEDLQVGEMVLTHEGRWKPILAKVCNGVRPIVRTTAHGVADLRTTPDHKVWTRRASTCHPRKAAMAAQPEWMAAEETLGSYLNLKLPPVEESNLTALEWWIAGRWLGDGHHSVRGLPLISCPYGEMAELAAKMGDRAGAISDTGTCNQVYVKGSGKGHPDDRLHLLIKRFGSGAHVKRVPVEAMALKPELAEAFLAGYLSSDGHLDKLGRWHASSVSRALVLGMALVAQRARGSVASVFAGRKGGEGTILGRKVKTRDEWKFMVSERNASAFLAEDGAWKKVRSVEPAGEAEVWDIKVEDDSSFTAEGCIVHNCPLQLDVIKRAVVLWSNPGELVFSPFSGIGSEGYQALKEGRRFLGAELKPEYFAQATRNLNGARAQGDLFSLLKKMKPGHIGGGAHP